LHPLKICPLLNRGKGKNFSVKSPIPLHKKKLEKFEKIWMNEKHAEEKRNED